MANKKKSGSHMKIHTKLVIYFSVLLAIPILILGGYSYIQARENLERQSEITIENNLNGIVSEVDALSSWENTYLKYLAYNQNFRTMLSQKDLDRGQIAMEMNRTVEPTLWYYITSDNYVKGIEIFTPRIEDHIGSFLKSDESVSGENWYQSCLEENQTQWFWDGDELFLARSILDAATSSTPIGVMRVKLFYPTFTDSMRSMRYLNNGLLVLDQAGDVIYDRPIADKQLDEQIKGNIRQGSLQDTGRYLIRSEEIPATNWDVYYYVDRALIIGQIQEILRRTFLVVGIVVALAIALISAFSRSLSRRILFLKDSAEAVASGNLDLDIHTEDTDEIGVVINSFGTMTRQLDQMINKIYKMQLEEKAVELKALQSQINPHFLYNALSSIKWKAIRQKNTDISEITGLLAKYYRTSLNNGENFTTVEHEIENIQSYIELQRRMHDVPFEAEYRIQPETLPLQMLNFLLQPIVENAFKHGIDYTDKEGNGKIIIEACTDEEYLYFHIRNNGPRIEPEKMKEILENPGKRYGIFNIQERISLYYGNGCGLQASVDENGYTVFTVKLLKTCTMSAAKYNIK